MKDRAEQEQLRQTAVQVAPTHAIDHMKVEWLGTVSHELRSPLTAIKGYVTTLLRQEHRLGRKERQEFLQAIDKASDRLELIINRFLEVADLESGTMVPHFTLINVEQLVREVISTIQYTREYTREKVRAEDQFTIIVAAPESALLVQADLRLLHDALYMVLENATKYSPAGGTITIQIATRPEDEMLVTSVQDTGRGIPPEHLSQIFERFYRVDTSLTREVDGIGLGLAICKRIIELHGGSVWVESEPGVGSTFYLALPLAKEPVVPT